MAKRSKKGGFTLVEIMIVVAVIALVMAIITPNFLRMRTLAKERACIATLGQIYTGKTMWEIENSYVDPVSMEQLVPNYVKRMSVCPSGGEYTVGDPGDMPTCSIEGHELQ